MFSLETLDIRREVQGRVESRRYSKCGQHNRTLKNLLKVDREISLLGWAYFQI
jgi:hypothetical protein